MNLLALGLYTEFLCLVVLTVEIDGGGIRGVSELLILHEIMKRIQYDLKLLYLPPPCDFFDVIGGTSTGGKVFCKFSPRFRSR